MFLIISVVQKKSSLSRLFGRSDSPWGGGSLDSAQKYILYIFIALALLFLIKAAVKAFLSTLEKEEDTDSQYHLKKLSTRIEHFKGLVSSKTTFNYRIFDQEKKEGKWRDGKFLSMDKKKNLVLALYSTAGKPGEYLNKTLEIKFIVGKNRGIVKSPLLKYVGSKKSVEGSFICMYAAELPLSIELEPKRNNIRFEVAPNYPMRVYIFNGTERLDFPIAADCLNFSEAGMFLELRDVKTGCIEYLIKKGKIISKDHLNEEQAEKLSFYKILSQPELELSEARKAKKKEEQHLNEWIDSIEMAKEFISSLEKEDVVKVFFILPELPMLEDAKEELLSIDNRTIMCEALINKKTTDEKSEKRQLSLEFLEVDTLVRDTIYQYGLESWRE